MTDDYFTPLGDPNLINDNLLLALNRVYIPALIERTPYKTGEVSGSWEVVNPSPFLFEFTNPYGTIIFSLENDVQEHIIKAKKKKFLKFKKPATRKSEYRKIPGNQAFEKGGYIYAKMVRHPGWKGRRFVQGVFEDQSLYEQFQDEFVSLMQDGS